MPKRTASGLVKYTTKTKTVSSRARPKQYKKRTVKRRGRKMEMGYSFSRWITALGQMNVNLCTYDTGTSVIAATVASGNTTCSFSTNFLFSDLPNVAEFQNLFDNYMITGVKVQIKMLNNPDGAWPLNSASSTGNQSNFYPTIWYVSDNDDHNTMTLAAIKEFQGVRHRVLKPNTELNIMVRPKTLTQTFRTALTTGYSTNKKNLWLDMAQTDIPHYALKCVIDFEGLSPSSQYSFKINARYFFKTKHVR